MVMGTAAADPVKKVSDGQPADLFVVEAHVPARLESARLVEVEDEVFLRLLAQQRGDLGPPARRKVPAEVFLAASADHGDKAGRSLAVADGLVGLVDDQQARSTVVAASFQPVRRPVVDPREVRTVCRQVAVAGDAADASRRRREPLVEVKNDDLAAGNVAQPLLPQEVREPAFARPGLADAPAPNVGAAQRFNGSLPSLPAAAGASRRPRRRSARGDAGSSSRSSRARGRGWSRPPPRR